MHKTFKENEQFIGELAILRQRIAEFESNDIHDLLASIVTGSADAIIGKDLNGNIRSWNKGAESIYGYTEEEVKGHHVSILTPKDHAEEITKILERIKQGERVSHYETVRVRKDGTPLTVSLAVSPIRDVKGSLTGISTIARDVTEKKQAEESLRLAGVYNRNLIEASLDPLVTISPDGRISDVNAATELVTGYSRRELIGTDFSNYFTEPDMARAGYTQAFKEGFVRDYALEIRHRDGHITPVLYNASVYRDESGKVIGIFAAARDITELKRAERELHSASLYARSLIEASLDPLVTISPDGKVMDVNRATEDITGVYRKDLIGTDFSDYFTEPAKARAGYEKVFREGFVKDYPLAIRHTSGKITQVLYNATTYCDENGEIQGVFAAARDVSELRQAQQALLESLNELETRNILLQEEITQRKQAEEEKKALENQLIQAQKMEALDRFAGGIAHDLNNILYPIIINLEGLLDEEPPYSDRHNVLDQTLKAACRQRDLVKKILSFSRLSDRVFKPFGIRSLLEDTINFLRSSLPSTISIQKSISVQTDLVKGDPVQIQQVILNLFKNAEDALESGKGIIEVGLTNIHISPDPHQDMQDGDYLKLTIKDTGIGIRPQVMDKIFEPFFTTKGLGKGTGLGLSVAHGIVKSHGGAITVESEEGKGSLFTIYLPVSDGGYQALDAEPAPEVQYKEKILLVDDEEIILYSLQRALKIAGYHVVVFKDGQEALNLFARNPDDFDMVITDLTMPGMTGIELSRKILAICPNTPILLCTGFNDVISQEEAKALGIRELLLKPTGSRELKNTISRILGSGTA